MEDQMKNRIWGSLMALALAIAVVSLAPVLVAGDAGQGPSPTAKTTAPARTWTPPHTPWGHPDLQGIWNNSTLTPLERPQEHAGKEFLTEREAAEFEKELLHRTDADRRDGAGTDADLARAYNNLWYDRGTIVATRRTSLIVDPPDGRLPSLTPEARKRQAARPTSQRSGGPADSWEDRSLAERCLIYRGVPAFPTGYNNNYHIVQTPQYVAILQESIHDVRMIPLDGRPHVGQNIRQWLGDSRGRWEGNTLVVETTNFSERALIRNFNGQVSEALHVVERFTRVSPDMVDYQFTVTDPKTWTRPWSGSLPMTSTEGPIFEYACHEGNYGMANLLAIARAEEKAAEEAAKKR
jgi:hypothetical protein